MKFILIIALLYTTDIYSQWIQQTVPNDAFIFHSINFENSNSGIVTGYRLGSNTTEFRSLRTTNGGVNWIYVTAPDSFRVIAQFEYIGPQTAFGSGAYNTVQLDKKPESYKINNFRGSTAAATGMSMGQNTKAAFFKTTNGGASWNIIGTLPSQYTYATYLDFLNANTGMVIVSLPQSGPGSLPYNILKTTDAGSSWTPTFPQPITGDLKCIIYVNENLAFSCGETTPMSDTSKGLFLKTTNGGMNWIKTINDTLLYGKLCFINASTGFVNVYNLNNDFQQILRTTDQGNSWKIVLSEDSLYIGGLNFYGQTGTGFMYATNTGFDTYEAYSYRTSNFGETWVRHSIVHNNPILLSGSMIDKYNYYVAGGGFEGEIYHTTNGGSVGVSSNTQIIPEKYSLSQNYPNPFNPSTTIQYNVPFRSNIILNVYNINGKEISTLVNEIKSQGIYEVKFDAANLPSGVYYYKLISGDFSEAKKMILIK